METNRGEIPNPLQRGITLEERITALKQLFKEFVELTTMELEAEIKYLLGKDMDE